jgi:hypothetical protein
VKPFRSVLSRLAVSALLLIVLLEGLLVPSAKPVLAIAGMPTITNVYPAFGLTTGGTSVTLTGTNFTGASGVTFGGAAATSYIVNSPTQITATTPAGMAGAVDVTVTTFGGMATSTGGYTYEVPPPTITDMSPVSGPAAGGTVVTFTGTNLSSVTSVTFEGTAATSIVITSDTQIKATAPAGAAGVAHVVITTAGGTLTLPYTYIPAPTITSVSPASGPKAGGATVTIMGTDLTGITSVTFGGTAAASYVRYSATKIVAVTPAGAPGAVDVAVTTAGGTATSTNGYTYLVAPTITSVSPSAGPLEDDTVTITGTNFTGATAVTFGGEAATSFTVDSATQITAVTPFGPPGTVDVAVTAAGGTATATGGYTYVAVPTVSDVSPSVSPAEGGGTVVITGTNFTHVTAVTFGGIPATSFTVDSATQITAITPAVAEDAADTRVAVTTAGGTVKVGYLFLNAPTITSASPSSGPTAGGTTVTISGTNLVFATAVTFGGVAATSFTVDSSSKITAVTPAGTAGAVDVAVLTPNGTVTSTGGYTYGNAPTITSVSPSSGPTAGGTTVTITGTNFTGAMAVTFGGAAATSYNVNSATQITATSPVGAAGAVNVAVTTAGGTATSTGAYTYVAAPTITSVSPSSGPTAGGTTVTITGTNFTGATVVKFGGASAASYTVNSATQITATSPTGAAGAVNVAVTTAGGTATSTGGYTYVAAPTITSASPSSGPTAGGTTVTITGTNFTGATAVKFGGAAATSFTVNSATQITATSPAGAAGAVNVAVTTAGGTATSTGAYTYVAAPTITSVSPSSGPTAGGTTVTITGTNFTGATAVKFGCAAAASYTVNSATQITATTPAGAAGAVNIAVTTAGGTATKTGGFTYNALPSENVSSSPVETTTPKPDNGIPVLINGKPERIGTAATKNQDGQNVTTVSVDEKKLNEMLGASGEGTVVGITAQEKSEALVGELTGDMVKSMELKNAVIEIKSDNATYTLPAAQVNIDELAKQFGSGVNLQTINVRVEISAPEAETVSIVENAAAKGEFTLVAPPVHFTVKGSYEGQEVEVSKFNAFVERTIAIPDGIDPTKITTGVVMEPDGTVRHVPTRIIEIDGKYFAKINSMTNSVYSVVWHPLEFKDVQQHWAKDAIKDMGSRMVINGTGEDMFSPDQDITRAEFAAVLVRGLGLKPEQGESPFTDVKASDWYSGVIHTAAKYQLIRGFEDGTFRPLDKITREQAMTIITNAMAVTKLKDKLTAATAEVLLSSFTDAAQASVWAVQGIADSLQAGIVTGRNGHELAPQANVTRAEVAVMIQRLLKESGLI